MKKTLLLFLLILPFMASCSSDNDDNSEPKQNYTSFVFVNTSKTTALKDCLAGYKLSDNTFKKVADLGDIEALMTSKEIILEDTSIKTIYIFAYVNSGTYMIDEPFNIELNKKNVLSKSSNTYTIQVEDITNPLQYPQ